MEAEVSEVCSRMESAYSSIEDRVSELKTLMTNSEPQHAHSLLALKNQALAMYLTNTLQYLQYRLSSTDLSDQKVIKRLLYLRFILEKTRPLHKKLRYTIEKQLQSARLGQVQDDSSNPLSFRPNLSNIDLEDDETSSKNGKPGIYRPPKINPMVYDEGPTRQDERQQEYLRKKVQESDLFKIYQKNIHPYMPEERDTLTTKAYEKDDRELYEEANFMRLNRSKKEKVQERLKRRGEISNSNTLIDFNRDRDLEALVTMGEIKSTKGGKKRKRTKGKKGNKGKKKGKRRKRT